MCGGGARFTGASDSLKAVSGRSTGGTADAPKTHVIRNRAKIRQYGLKHVTPSSRFGQRLGAKLDLQNCQNVQSLHCGDSDHKLIVRRLVPGPRCVLVASGGHGADLSHAAECLGSNIGTIRVVAEIFNEQFFAPVWRREARFDRYLRNRESPTRMLLFSDK
jgi:hypothetical protein